MYIGVYWCIFVYICVYLCIFVYIGVYWCILVYIGVYLCIFVYICVYLCILLYICVYCCILDHSYVHTQTLKYTSEINMQEQHIASLPRNKTKSPTLFKIATLRMFVVMIWNDCYGYSSDYNEDVEIKMKM